MDTSQRSEKEMLRVPPHNLEAERSVLGALMLDKDAIIKVADFLSPEDFYHDTHTSIYESMLSLYDEREPIDVLSLSNKLNEKKQLDSVGGSGFLASIVAEVPSAQNILHYAKIVQKKSLLRKLLKASVEISELGYDEVEDIDKILDLAEQKIFNISSTSKKQDFTAIKDILSESFARMDEMNNNKGQLRGVPTGYLDLDQLLSGFQRSDLIILAARPSIGKSTIAMDIARHIGVREKIPVGVFSLEMSSDQLVDRMLAAQSSLDLWKLRTGNLTKEDFGKISEGMGVLSEAPIFIDDSGSANIMELRTLARRLQAEHNLGLIIIDYLQLMEGRSKENRVQEISEISRSLKQLARELNIPILALSQLSRSVEQRSPQIPKLSDLRESGSIEQDADIVMFLYREDREKPDTPNKNIVQVIVSKHRNGPVGTVSLYFDEKSTTFRSLEKTGIQFEPIPQGAPQE